MLQGQIALVTGASRGIGQAVALDLGRNGATVIGTATSASGAEKIGAYLNEAGIKGAGFALDVNDKAQVAAVLEMIQKQFGDIAILVYSPGPDDAPLFHDVRKGDIGDGLRMFTEAKFRIAMECRRESGLPRRT